MVSQWIFNESLKDLGPSLGRLCFSGTWFIRYPCTAPSPLLANTLGLRRWLPWRDPALGLGWAAEQGVVSRALEPPSSVARAFSLDTQPFLWTLDQTQCLWTRPGRESSETGPWTSDRGGFSEHAYNRSDGW